MNWLNPSHLAVLIIINQIRLFFVLSYVPRGDLHHYLNQVEGGRLSLELAKLYAAELYLALQFLHDNRVIYRDLKASNVLLDEKGVIHHCYRRKFGRPQYIADLAVPKKGTNLEFIEQKGIIGIAGFIE